MSSFANKLRPIAIAVAAVAALVGKSIDSAGTIWSKAAKATSTATDVERSVKTGSKATRLGRAISWVQVADNVSTGAEAVELVYEVFEAGDDVSAVPEDVMRAPDTVACRVDAGERSVVVAAGGLKPVRVNVGTADAEALAKDVTAALEKAEPQLARRFEAAKSVVLCTRGPALDTAVLLKGKARYAVPVRPASATK